MNSFKAVVIGSLFILIVGAIVQLANIFIAVGYNELVKSYPLLNGMGDYFRYLIGIPVFLLVMFVGGYITAAVAQEKALLNSLLVAIVTIGIMLFPALSESEMTISGFFIFGLAFASTLGGGFYWQRKNR